MLEGLSGDLATSISDAERARLEAEIAAAAAQAQYELHERDRLDSEELIGANTMGRREALLQLRRIEEKEKKAHEKMARLKEFPDDDVSDIEMTPAPTPKVRRRSSSGPGRGHGGHGGSADTEAASASSLSSALSAFGGGGGGRGGGGAAGRIPGGGEGEVGNPKQPPSLVAAAGVGTAPLPPLHAPRPQLSQDGVAAHAAEDEEVARTRASEDLEKRKGAIPQLAKKNERKFPTSMNNN
jgi:hypothetical protein